MPKKELLDSTEYVIGCYSTRTIAFEVSSEEALNELRDFYATVSGVVPHPSLCVYTREEWARGYSDPVATAIKDVMKKFTDPSDYEAACQDVLSAWEISWIKVLDTVALAQKRGTIKAGCFKELLAIHNEEQRTRPPDYGSVTEEF